MLIRSFDPAASSLATAVEGVAIARNGVPASTPATPAPSRDAVDAAVRSANAALAARSAALQFTVDPDTRAVVVRLIDTEDNQVLRQVPSEEMLAIAKAIDRMEVTLLRNRA